MTADFQIPSEPNARALAAGMAEPVDRVAAAKAIAEIRGEAIDLQAEARRAGEAVVAFACEMLLAIEKGRDHTAALAEFRSKLKPIFEGLRAIAEHVAAIAEKPASSAPNREPGQDEPEPANHPT